MDKKTEFIILLILAPILLWVTTFPLHICASIVSGSNIGLSAFIYASAATMLLMGVFVRSLNEIGQALRNLMPTFAKIRFAPPSFTLALVVWIAIIVSATYGWYRTAFPPANLLFSGHLVTAHIVRHSVAATDADDGRFYSRQVWISPVKSGSDAAEGTKQAFPLLARQHVSEETDPAQIREDPMAHKIGSETSVWTVDSVNGPFYEARLNARGLAALIWYGCAAFVMLGFVTYYRLRLKNGLPTVP